MVRTRPVVLLIALLGAAAEAPACPLCKESLDGSAPAEQAGLGRGFSRSILLMIGAPFTILGIGTFAVVRAARRGAMPEL